MTLLQLLSIGIGGFFGAITRFLISLAIQKWVGVVFPLGTLVVNVLGSFLIGFLYMYFSHVIHPIAKMGLMTGFLGALTTFSTFSLETVLLLQDGLYLKAGLNILLNVVLSILATILAIILFKKVYGGI